MSREKMTTHQHQECELNVTDSGGLEQIAVVTMSQIINVQYYVEVELQQGCNFMYYH